MKSLRCWGFRPGAAMLLFTALVSGALLASAGVSAPAGAQSQSEKLVDAADPSSLLDVMRRFGAAQLGVDPLGDPQITGEIGGRPYQIIFHDCRNGGDCGLVLFATGFTGTQATAEDMARWNRESLIGTAYLDEEGDPILDFMVNLRGGVSQENWTRTAYWWVIAMRDFETHLAAL